MSDTEQIGIEVLVIGAGGCGLTAALAACAEGAQVAILEKNVSAGGNTALSSGSIPAAGSVLQRDQGVDDSAAAFAADLFQQSGSHDADALVHTLTDMSAELIDFLLAQGVCLELVTGYRHVGHRTFRLHAPPSRRGADLVNDLLEATKRQDIPLAVGQAANGLVVDNGRVAGAFVGDERLDAKAVILACNGFGGSPALLENHCPAVVDAMYAGSSQSKGDGLSWGIQLGAATGNLGAYQAHAGLSVRTGALLTWTLVERGAIIIDGHCRRFADETLGYSSFADVMFAHKGPFYLIYDTLIRDDVARGQPDFAEACQMGIAKEADRPDTLAEMIDVDADAFVATLNAVRKAASGPGKDHSGREDWGNGPLTDRLCAAEIKPALFHTQGGLAIDAHARVLNEGGQPIPGLYAGGGAAMGISGRRGGGGYVSGNGLLSALGLGLIAGRNATQHARKLPTTTAPQREPPVSIATPIPTP